VVAEFGIDCVFPRTSAFSLFCVAAEGCGDASDSRPDEDDFSLRFDFSLFSLFGGVVDDCCGGCCGGGVVFWTSCC
jgi:hypothetical protein